MSCIRLTCADDARLVELADKLLTAWRGYTDESCFIFAETDGEPDVYKRQKPSTASSAAWTCW